MQRTPRTRYATRAILCYVAINSLVKVMDCHVMSLGLSSVSSVCSITKGTWSECPLCLREFHSTHGYVCECGMMVKALDVQSASHSLDSSQPAVVHQPWAHHSTCASALGSIIFLHLKAVVHWLERWHCRCFAGSSGMSTYRLVVCAW